MFGLRRIPENVQKQAREMKECNTTKDGEKERQKDYPTSAKNIAHVEPSNCLYTTDVR